MNRRNGRRCLGAAAMTCALAACGGGGGGGGGGGDGLGVTSNANSLQLVGILPNASTSNTVTFTLSGGSGQTLYAAADTGMANLQANVVLTSRRRRPWSRSPTGRAATRPGAPPAWSRLNCAPTRIATMWSESHAYPVTSTRFQVAAQPLTLTGSEVPTTTVVPSWPSPPPDTDHLLSANTDVLSGSTELADRRARRHGQLHGDGLGSEPGCGQLHPARSARVDHRSRLLFDERVVPRWATA